MLTVAEMPRVAANALNALAFLTIELAPFLGVWLDCAGEEGLFVEEDGPVVWPACDD